MARGGKRNRSNERVASANATAIRAVLGMDEITSPAASYSLLSEVQDNRTFHPDPEFRPALRVFGSPASFSVGGDRVQAPNPIRPPGGLLGSAQTFIDSGSVVVCVRRGQRRQVLFALRRTSGGSGKRRFTRTSKIRCR